MTNEIKLNLPQNIAVKFLLKLFAKPTLVSNGIKYASGQAAAWILSSLASSPLWLQNALSYLSEKQGIELNEASLTIVCGFLFSEILQVVVNKINYSGIDQLQKVVKEERDGWVGNETVGSVLTMKENLDSAWKEIASLKNAITQQKEEKKG